MGAFYLALMIRNELKSKHEGEVQNTYVEPDVWTTEVTIDDPRTEEFVGSKPFTSYRVTTVTTYPQFGGGQFAVRRRYSDFAWLYDHLETELTTKKWKRPVERLPDLPGDTFSSFFGWGRMEPDFIEDRRKKLALFLSRLTRHPQCATNKALIRFLKDDDMKVRAHHTPLIMTIHMVLTHTSISVHQRGIWRCLMNS